MGGERAGRGWLCESNGPRHESEVRARHGDRQWSGGVGVRGDSSRRTASAVAAVLEAQRVWRRLETHVWHVADTEF